MKKKLLLGLLISPFCLFSQGYKLHTQGQKQQAMGGAGVGFVTDAAGMFYNPASVSFLKGSAVSLGGSFAISKTTVLETESLVLTESETPASAIPTLYAMFGSRKYSSQLKYFKFGLGVYSGFGSSIKYPQGWSGRYIINEQVIKTISLQPTVSYRVNKKLGIGGGLVYTMGSLLSDVDVPVIDVSGNIGNSVIEGNFKGAIGFNAGVYIMPTKQLSIGLNYRSAQKMELKEGTAEFSNIPVTLQDSIQSGGAQLETPLPQNIAVGFGYKFNKLFALTGEFNYVGFGVIETTDVEFDEDITTETLENISKRKNFRDAYSANLGMQYRVHPKIMARAGARYVWSAIPLYTRGPDGFDDNRMVFSLGGTVKPVKELEIDFSYTFEYLSAEEILNNDYAYIASYKTMASIFGLSALYKF